MELRYLGFDQTQNARVYRFDLPAKGDSGREFIVTVDLALFRTHHVGIQEGPSLCARKLSADLEKGWEGDHELTTADLQAYADARTAAEVRKAESRARFRRPKAATAHPQSPWQTTQH
jgi:hypothetical protein